MNTISREVCLEQLYVYMYNLQRYHLLFFIFYTMCHLYHSLDGSDGLTPDEVYYSKMRSD